MADKSEFRKDVGRGENVPKKGPAKNPQDAETRQAGPQKQGERSDVFREEPGRESNRESNRAFGKDSGKGGGKKNIS